MDLAGSRNTVTSLGSPISAYSHLPNTTISDHELLHVEGKQSREFDVFAVSSLPAPLTPAPLNAPSESIDRYATDRNTACVSAMSTRKDSRHSQEPFNGRQDLFEIAIFNPQPPSPGPGSPPQTPLRPTRYYQFSTPRQCSGLATPPQTPLRSIRYHQFGTLPQHSESGLLPQTPLRPAKRYQHSHSLQNILSGSLLQSPSRPVKRRQLSAFRKPTASRPLPRKALNYTEPYDLAILEDHSSSVSPSQIALEVTSLGQIDTPFHQSKSKSPSQMQARSTKYSGHLTPRRRKPLTNLPRPSESAKGCKSSISADGLRPDKLPRVLDFVNLTPDDSFKIMTGVAPTGRSRKQQ